MTHEDDRTERTLDQAGEAEAEPEAKPRDWRKIADILALFPGGAAFWGAWTFVQSLASPEDNVAGVAALASFLSGYAAVRVFRALIHGIGTLVDTRRDAGRRSPPSGKPRS